MLRIESLEIELVKKRKKGCVATVIGDDKTPVNARSIVQNKIKRSINNAKQQDGDFRTTTDLYLVPIVQLETFLAYAAVEWHAWVRESELW